ncbi:MAG: argininosuccinate lyase [Flavobacteriaceae bacterium]|nr:argininosuccinate lyase [Flavobacteriaceae bacterium]|tara:strand:- start:266 stop:1549 length:1284 start_codon:yes stop_codon:yes gene_type:complete
MKLWQKKKTSVNEQVDRFTVGADRLWDIRLAPYDVLASKAHAKMLASVGLVTDEESKQLCDELDNIVNMVTQENFLIENDFEDIHSKIEFLLTESLGDVGKKIHTARSRNDQVLTAMQLLLKDELSEIKALTKDLFDTWMGLANTHKDVLLPGYTHLQVAMPSSFGLWFSAYAECLVDDIVLLNAAYSICDQNPLGSAAGYGSSFNINRELTTKALGFSALKVNAVAAQMGRGKTERITANAMGALAATLGRFSMDVCVYMSQNFDFISFPDHLTTGSSIMPHKKNPDIFELIRGKSALIQGLGNDFALLGQNLPSGYHREMQLFKGKMLEGIDELKDCLTMLNSSIKEVQVRTEIMADAKYTYAFTVDALNELVKQGVPFRDAYNQVGQQVEEGSFKAPKKVAHTHIGSLGNLALEKIQKKFDKQY